VEDKHLYPRRAEGMALEALSDTRVVVVNGARQVGKSTLAKLLVAGTAGARELYLDDPAVRAAAEEDPSAFVRHDGLLLIDEIQRVPELLLPIKREVDREGRACWVRRSFSARRTAVSLSSSVFFPGAGDQPVLRFDGVVLTQRAVGLIAGAFGGQFEDGQPLPEVGVRFGERFGGRLQRRRFQHGEQLGQDRLLESDAADRQAASFGAVQLFAAGANIAGAVAFGARIAGLHGPPALSADQYALQQRPALAGCSAVAAGGRTGGGSCRKRPGRRCGWTTYEANTARLRDNWGGPARLVDRQRKLAGCRYPHGTQWVHLSRVVGPIRDEVNLFAHP
jgi:hypothetical protein